MRNNRNIFAAVLLDIDLAFLSIIREQFPRYMATTIVGKRNSPSINWLHAAREDLPKLYDEPGQPRSDTVKPPEVTTVTTELMVPLLLYRVNY